MQLSVLIYLLSLTVSKELNVVFVTQNLEGKLIADKGFNDADIPVYVGFITKSANN